MNPRASFGLVVGSLVTVSAFVVACDGGGAHASGDSAAPSKAKGPGLGEIMVGVGRRFEIAGRAALAHRWELAEFEVGEIGESFEDDIPGAEMPKEGPTAHIPTFAAAFLKTNVPELKKAAKSGDAAAFAAAYKTTAAACNTCHTASAKGFIEIPAVPGQSVPLVDEKGAAAPAGETRSASARPVALPGATAPAALDYIAYEASPHGGRVWVPAGGSGSVDVLDVETGVFHKVDGWKTAEREGHGGRRVVGPSSVAIGNGYAYVGSRAVNEVCSVDLKTLAKGPCLPMASPVDGIAADRTAKQVWATTPADGSVAVLDELAGGSLKLAGTVKVPGKPEGYAFDEAHGLFFTNLEDKAKTVVVDVKTRAVRSTWSNGCGEEGPRGIAVDGARSLVFVACTDHVEVLDGAHDGALLGKVDTGAGVDNIDYSAARELLYVAAAKAKRLTVLHAAAKGKLEVVTETETREGARNAVADSNGAAYVADPAGASLLIVPPHT